MLERLGLTGVTLVGFCMGSGEVVRYLSTYRTARVVQAVLAATVTPGLRLGEKSLAEVQTSLRENRIAFLNGQPSETPNRTYD